MTVAQLDAQKGKVDREALLGRLLWFTVPESTLLDYQKTLDELGRQDLTRALPLPPKDYDTFRRITSDAEKAKVPHFQAGVQLDMVENWMVRDVSSDEKEIVRRAVVELRDAKNQKLAYEEVVDMVFVKPTGSQTNGRLRFDWISNPTDWPFADQMVQQVRARYNQERGKLASGVVRSWLTKTIRSMGGVACRPNGGVYFLEETLADQVETLEAFCLKHLPNGGECAVVPLIDSDKQREMIRRSIERETIGSIEEITQEINEIRREGKLTSNRYVDIQRRVKAVKAKQGKYMTMLAKDEGAIRSRLGLLETLAGELEPLQAKVTRKRKPKDQPVADEPAERPISPLAARFLED